MTFRRLSTGVLFRFAQYDDPWSGTSREGTLWRKINNSFYIGSSSRQSRTASTIPIVPCGPRRNWRFGDRMSVPPSALRPPFDRVHLQHSGTAANQPAEWGTGEPDRGRDPGSSGLTLFRSSKAEKEECMKTKVVAIARAVESNDDWKQKAYLAVCEFCNKHAGKEHLAEEIRVFAEAQGVAPLNDARAWGPILKRAEKNGVIKNVGYAPTKSSNGGPKVF